MKQKKNQVFSINIGFIFISWYEIYHISLMAIATCEIFIFKPLDENKSGIYRKNLNIFYIYFSDLFTSVLVFISVLQTYSKADRQGISCP